MDAFLIYSLKLAVFLLILYICIKAFLSRETFFCFNRWVLLASMGLCLLLPFIKVPISESMTAYIPTLILENYFEDVSNKVLIDREPTYIETKSIENTEIADYTHAIAMPDGTFADFKPYQILIVLYFIGLLINAIILGRSIYLMLKLIQSNPAQNYQEYRLTVTSDSIVPFSWRRYIVISKADLRNNPDEILTHEIAHIKHRHSWDIVFMESILLLQWFNPAAWLLKRELKDIHEFQADKSVLESGIDTTKYQLLLVKKAVGTSSYTLANSFNHSKIKKRITMMLKEKSSKWARLKLLLLLPLGTLTVLSFASPEMNEPANSLVDYESTINFEENKISPSPAVQYVHQKEIVKFSHVGDNGKILFSYPVFYSETKDGETLQTDNFVMYVVKDKKYTRKEFERLINGRKFVENKTDIKSREANIIEFHCITQKGLKTPTWYMVIIEEEA